MSFWFWYFWREESIRLSCQQQEGCLPQSSETDRRSIFPVTPFFFSSEYQAQTEANVTIALQGSKWSYEKPKSYFLSAYVRHTQRYSKWWQKEVPKQLFRGVKTKSSHSNRGGCQRTLSLYSQKPEWWAPELMRRKRVRKFYMYLLLYICCSKKAKPPQCIIWRKFYPREAEITFLTLRDACRSHCCHHFPRSLFWQADGSSFLFKLWPHWTENVNMQQSTACMFGKPRACHACMNCAKKMTYLNYIPTWCCNSTTAESHLGICVALDGLPPFCTAVRSYHSGNVLCEAVQGPLLWWGDILAVIGAAGSDGTGTLSLNFVHFD